MTNKKKVYKEKDKQKDPRAILMQMIKEYVLRARGAEDDLKGERSVKGVEGQKRMESKMQEGRSEERIKYSFVSEETVNGHTHYFVGPLCLRETEQEKGISTFISVLTPTMPQPKKSRRQSSKKEK